MNEHTKPAGEIRLGAIKATIWRNETETGARFNTVVSRIYRDGEQWKSTDSFGRDDLLLLAKVANEAHSWIFAQGREGAPTPSTAPVAASPAPPAPNMAGRSQPGRGR